MQRITEKLEWSIRTQLTAYTSDDKTEWSRAFQRFLKRRFGIPMISEEDGTKEQEAGR